MSAYLFGGHDSQLCQSINQGETRHLRNVTTGENGFKVFIDDATSDLLDAVHEWVKLGQNDTKFADKFIKVSEIAILHVALPSS